MFDNIAPAPADPILGLAEQFKKDSRPDKINLGVGVFQDENGHTPVLKCVRRVESELLEREKSKTYLGIAGDPEYGDRVQELVFGQDHGVVRDARCRTAQTPGGTGALRVGADLIGKLRPGAAVWISDPTWANHAGVFKAAGLEVKTYPYYDAARNAIALDRMAAALEKANAGDLLLLHACCHNPTGIDPSSEQWAEIIELAARVGLVVFFDFAYQGFGRGVEEDAEAVRLAASRNAELMVASSFSKNFGLYNERTGALSLVAAGAQAADSVFTHVKTVIRSNYSNPPARGAAIVKTILGDTKLKSGWLDEVEAMRSRIGGMRGLFVKTLAEMGVKRDFGFLNRQLGMFSFSGLTKDQVRLLKEKHGVYMVDSGRINVAGMTPENMGRLCEAIAEALGG